VAAPSGTGKTTVCRAVAAADSGVVFSVSHTTRPRRAGEVDGVDYFFVSIAEFERLIEEGAFLEWAVYNGNHYGTSWRAIERPLSEGRDLLLEIEVQGARQVQERRGDARFLFLLPPSMKTLKERLESRGTDSAEEVERRLRVARLELDSADRFQYAVVNDDLDRCVAQVLEILKAERRGATDALRRRFAPQGAVERLRQERV
jgi:guanylate kinase